MNLTGTMPSRFPAFGLDVTMNASKQKIVQYLNEARASEDALVRVLQSQIAMTPRGSYRTALETHLDETRKHSKRVGERLQALGLGSSPLMTAIGFWEDMAGQALALGKTPFDLLRGSGGEEKVLKNAKDACATEALEIATYTAIERMARTLGDRETAALAASIRADEEKMLQRILRELPKLTDAVVRADVNGDGSYDITTTGAGEAVREAGTATRDAVRKTTAATKRTARKTTAATKRTARKTTAATERTASGTTAATKRTARRARKVPGVAQAEGQIKGALASEGDLAIARYDTLTADEVNARLSELSQIDLAKVDSYERKNQDRTTVLDRIATLRGTEPWAGYDELTVAEVQPVLAEGDDQRAKQTRSYERAHKNRAGVVNATERETTNA
jgi:ferritin-like metal-binding protein YciE